MNSFKNNINSVMKIFFPTMMLGSMMIFLFVNPCLSEEAPPDPEKILEKVLDAYKSMETYKAQGTVTNDIEMNGIKTNTSLEFSILLKKPNLYRITWTQENSAIPGFILSGAVWSDGTQPFFYLSSVKAYSQMSSDEMALGAATGVSSGSAFTIPSAFLSVFKKEMIPFQRLKNLKLEGVEKIGSEECYVMSGSSKVSVKETYWISKSKNLIIQYARSFEMPKTAPMMPSMTEQQLSEKLEIMGDKVNEENKNQIKEKMDALNTFFKNYSLKGTSSELHADISSPVLEKKDFQFSVPEGIVLKESLFDTKDMFKQAKLQSLELIHAGIVKVNEVQMANGTKPYKNSCEYLTQDQFVEDTDKISAALKTTFGVAFKAQGEPSGGFVLLKVKYLHPPIKKPASEEVVTIEEFPLMVKIGEVRPIGWIFEYEWEIVPGEWILQILQDEKILIKKKFSVTQAPDIFVFMPEMGKRIQLLKEAISKNPKDAMAVKNLRNAYLDMRDFDTAIDLYTKAIALDPHPNFFNNRCLAWNDKKEYDKALEDCNKALSLYPNHTSALINRGNTFRFTGEYDTAIADYNQSLKAAPEGDRYNPPMAYYNRGHVYEEIGKLDLAIADFTKAIEFAPMNMDAYYSRAEVYEEQNDFVHAMADYKKVLQIHPDDLAAQKRLSILETRLESEQKEMETDQ